MKQRQRWSPLSLYVAFSSSLLANGITSHASLGATCLHGMILLRVVQGAGLPPLTPWPSKCMRHRPPVQLASPMCCALAVHAPWCVRAPVKCSRYSASRHLWCAPHFLVDILEMRSAVSKGQCSQTGVTFSKAFPSTSTSPSRDACRNRSQTACNRHHEPFPRILRSGARTPCVRLLNSQF